ncbi:4'-phosphopantetheinyl transferase superfamily protein [Methylocystis sp. H62]|uniref:4'-phosphopantetheinyl transferase family protein n=1 Tax=Methylocystis sp. H62 TaxID=2785789 RepID=UPI0018C30F96|nr:4'-phosphopantetheinyl transferase superfamily protein [Methylocystis sp. H62]MBG0794738.1 4'-phosphopantetheinyl transferase superfamily protein [Methylocystis sp. H62]
MFFIDVAKIADDEWPKLAALLDEAETARAARFAFDSDRRAYVAAHALLRASLSERAKGIAPAAWRFGVTPHGKPFLLSPHAGVDVSLSHTRGMAAVAIASGRDIGVDVESFLKPRDALRVAERFFAPEEAAIVRAQSDPQSQSEVFFAIWTLKEAVLKADGRGLAGGLDSFVVKLSPLAVSSDSSESYGVAQWRRAGFFIAAAARGEINFRLMEKHAAALIQAADSFEA